MPGLFQCRNRWNLKLCLTDRLRFTSTQALLSGLGLDSLWGFQVNFFVVFRIDSGHQRKGICVSSLPVSNSLYCSVAEEWPRASWSQVCCERSCVTRSSVSTQPSCSTCPWHPHRDITVISHEPCSVLWAITVSSAGGVLWLNVWPGGKATASFLQFAQGWPTVIAQHLLSDSLWVSGAHAVGELHLHPQHI